MSTIKLSVCMPTFNYGRYIRRAIDSVREQGVADVEVVVLDGGSTDDTRQVVEQAAAEWPAVYLSRASSVATRADANDMFAFSRRRLALRIRVR